MKEYPFRVIMALAAVVFIMAAVPGHAAILSMQTTIEGNSEATVFPVGSALYLNVMVDNPAGIAGVAFTVTYDAAYVTPPAIDTEGLPVNAADITSIFPFMYQGAGPTDTFRANGGTTGKIYLSGAAINESNGGALYPAGSETVLFTIKFMVKGDAPIGNFSFGLEQTHLFNPAAGYGTDVNGNGILDEGDSKDPVSVLVGALSTADTTGPVDGFGGDLSDDFPLITSSFNTPLEVETSNGWSIGGTISYSGPQTGTLKVAAFETTDINLTNPIGGQDIPWAANDTSKAFGVSVPNGNYKLGAYIETGNNTARDGFEAEGVYNTYDIAIANANDGTDRNFNLTDPDNDVDGIPGYWEAQFGLSDDTAADAALDGDSDGYSSLVEFQNGTDPTVKDVAGRYPNWVPVPGVDYQIVQISPASITTIPGGQVQASISYDTSDSDNTLTSMAFRVHFDSSILTYDSTANFFTTGSLIQAPEVYADDSDEDNDPDTDKYVLFSYSDPLGGAWPNTTLPQKLGDLVFNTAGNAPLDETKLRLSNITGHAGYEFAGIESTVKVIDFTLDIDGEGSGDGGTDGILLIRYLFTIRGDSLIRDVVAPTATRITAADIEGYLNANVASLDVDGNGTPDGGTDGILLIRYLFTIRGESLIRDVIAPDATRTTAAEIEAYLNSLMP